MAKKSISKEELIEYLSALLNKPYADSIKTLIAYIEEDKSPTQILNFWNS